MHAVQMHASIGTEPYKGWYRALQRIPGQARLPGSACFKHMSSIKEVHDDNVMMTGSPCIAERTMLMTMTFMRLSTVKSGCQLPGVPLVVSASRQIDPPAVT